MVLHESKGLFPPFFPPVVISPSAVMPGFTARVYSSTLALGPQFFEISNAKDSSVPLAPPPLEDAQIAFHAFNLGPTGLSDD